MTFTLEKFGADGLAPGDVIATNDPYEGGGTHLSDVTLVVPIFHGDELVAFAASKAHWTEVGGKDPGSWTTDSTEIFQEGLQLPCVKIWDAGQPVQSVIDVIAANVRLPEMTLGDMHAQAAALHLGEARFLQLCDKYGVEVVLGSMQELLDYGERATRRALAEPAQRRLRGREHDRRRRHRQRAVPGAREGDDHRRRVRLRLHGLAPAGARPGEHAR